MAQFPIYLIAILVPAYLLPSIIATARRHRYIVMIFVVNLLLGWTFYFWVVALVWATTAVPPPGPLRSFGRWDGGDHPELTGRR